MMLTLPPGAYTVQISGQGGTSGVGLAEVYEVEASLPGAAGEPVDPLLRGGPARASRSPAL